MDFPNVLQKGFKLLPPVFKEAYKTAEVFMGYAVGERNIITFSINGVELKFNIYYAHQIGHLQLHYIHRVAAEALKENDLPTLVLSPLIYPKIATKLLEMNANYMDSIGNVYINEKTIYKLNSKKKPGSTIPAKSRLFREAGLKLLFALLQDQEAVNFPYRDLAGMIGISPASITILYKEMIQSGYLLENVDDTKRLLRKRELLQRWVNGYQEILRPKFLVGMYQSFDKDFVRNYRKHSITDWQGSWGGEPAAAIYTSYLVPQLLTMYVPLEEKKWMKKLRLIPVETGPEIEVLKYFWDKDHPLFRVEPDLVPPLLVYAELTASGDSRNLETAQKLYDEFLQFIEQ
jgi:hypothetical protein